MVHSGVEVRVLITGANGFIGQNLYSYIRDEVSVVRHGRVGSNRQQLLDDYYEVEVNGSSDWEECLKEVDVVIHLAASAHNKLGEGSSIESINVDGTINLAEQAINAGVKRFVFLSSIGVLGRSSSHPLDENSKANPDSPYSLSKWKAECKLLDVTNNSGMEVVIIRPVLVYGVGAPGNFSRLVRVVKNFKTSPFALCRNKRSFISVDNLTSFIKLCSRHPEAANQVFCIAESKPISTHELVNAIAIGLGVSIVRLPIPMNFMRIMSKLIGKSNEAGQLLDDLEVDITKAKTSLGWVPIETMSVAMSKLKVEV